MVELIYQDARGKIRVKLHSKTAALKMLFDFFCKNGAGKGDNPIDEKRDPGTPSTRWTWRSCWRVTCRDQQQQ